MSEQRPHPKTLEEIERDCVPGLLEVLRTEGIDGVRYALWDMTGWHRDYDPCAWRDRATEEQKRVGWEMWVRMEKIIATVLREAHERQVGEVADALEEGPKGFCRTCLERECAGQWEVTPIRNADREAGAGRAAARYRVSRMPPVDRFLWAGAPWEAKLHYFCSDKQ